MSSSEVPQPTSGPREVSFWNGKGSYKKEIIDVLDHSAIKPGDYVVEFLDWGGFSSVSKVKDIRRVFRIVTEYGDEANIGNDAIFVRASQKEIDVFLDKERQSLEDEIKDLEARANHLRNLKNKQAINLDQK